MTSLLEESRLAKRSGFVRILKNKKLIIAIVAIIIIGGGYFVFGGEDNKENEAEAKEWTVRKSDLKIAIESDGKVVAEDGVELSFSVSGDTLEVKEVYIEEGDKIKKGDKIALVKTENLQFNLNKAYASYRSSLASFNNTVDGATEEEVAKAKQDIEQAEITLDQAKISLKKTKLSAEDKIRTDELALKDAKENLALNQDELTSEDVIEAYEDMVDTIKSIDITLEAMLPESDEIIGVDNESINNDYEDNIGAKDTQTRTDANGSYRLAKNKKEELDSSSVSLSKYSTFSEIELATEQAETALYAFEDHLYDMWVLLEATITSADFSQTVLDAFKSTISANRTSVNTKITSLNSGLRDIDDAKDGLDDYKDDYKDALKDLEATKEDTAQDIANSEANVRSKELALEKEKIDYDELVAPLTGSEYTSAQSSLSIASNNLAQARNDLEKATIISPIDGEVALLNYKTGDIILKDDNKPVIKIINTNTLFIEVNIEEAEINKIKVGQKANAVFDAVDGLELEGEIGFISLTSETDNSGIVTYLVRVIFENTEEAQIREGMTAFVDFVIAGVKDVLIVPVDAVRNIDGKPSVQFVGGAWAPVTTGFTDGKNVEVISGLNEGDKIIY